MFKSGFSFKCKFEFKLKFKFESSCDSKHRVSVESEFEITYFYLILFSLHYTFHFLVTIVWFIKVY